MFSVSVRVRSESVRISSATTAKPLPASPARALSIEAFNANKLVWEEISKIVLERLEFSEEEINRICYLVETHDTPITNKEIEDNLELTITKFKIQCCDALAHHPAKLEKRIKYLLSIYSKINDKLPCKKLILN